MSKLERLTVTRMIGVPVVMLAIVFLGWWLLFRLPLLQNYDAIVAAIETWKHEPPPGVAPSDWYHACETVRTVVGNTVLYSMSLREVRKLRTDVQRHYRLRAQIPEWLILRIKQSVGPRGVRYIQRMETWWEPRVIRVRATGGDPELATVYGQLAEWHERPPPRESSLAWYFAVNGLQAAIVRVYDVPCADTRDELHGLSGYIESLSAEPITAETLRRLADHLADSSPRGAEYMRRTDYLKNRFEFLDRTRRGRPD